MTIALTALAFAFAWSIGSHYTGACMGMPYALGALRARVALALMAPLALLGAATASGKVATTVGRKLIDATPSRLGELVIVAVAFAVTAAYNRVRVPPRRSSCWSARSSASRSAVAPGSTGARSSRSS